MKKHVIDASFLRDTNLFAPPRDELSEETSPQYIKLMSLNLGAGSLGIFFILARSMLTL